MIDRDLEIQTPDGDMTTFISHPEGDGPYPLILFLMDAPGKREELHDMARRLAAKGYYVMLPNLYYRRTPVFDVVAEGRDVMREHMASLSIPAVCQDVAAMLEFTTGDSAARAGAIGCVGYCMSGPFAFALAALEQRIAASASIHGVMLCSDQQDSPHLLADRVKGELYFGCAENDDYVPEGMIEALEKHLKQVGADYRIEWYPGTGHGFVFPQRGAAYNEEAAERHWERLIDLFQRKL